jgi:hypothetical protein
MSEGNTKTQKSTTVRIAGKVKKRLQKVARRKADVEEREVTEQELVNVAVDALCAKEEKKLGI